MIFVTCSKSLYLHRITIACNCFIWRIKISGIKHWRAQEGIVGNKNFCFGLLISQMRPTERHKKILTPGKGQIMWLKIADMKSREPMASIHNLVLQQTSRCMHPLTYFSFDTAIFTPVLVFFKMHFNILCHVFCDILIKHMTFVRMERLPFNNGNFNLEGCCMLLPIEGPRAVFIFFICSDLLWHKNEIEQMPDNHPKHLLPVRHDGKMQWSRAMVLKTKSAIVLGLFELFFLFFFLSNRKGRTALPGALARRL